MKQKKYRQYLATVTVDVWLHADGVLLEVDHITSVSKRLRDAQPHMSVATKDAFTSRRDAALRLLGEAFRVLERAATGVGNQDAK